MPFAMKEVRMSHYSFVRIKNVARGQEGRNADAGNRYSSLASHIH